MSASPASTRTPARAPARSLRRRQRCSSRSRSSRTRRRRPRRRPTRSRAIVQEHDDLALRAPVAPDQRSAPAELRRRLVTLKQTDHLPDARRSTSRGSASTQACCSTIQLDEAQATYDQNQNAQLTTQQAQSLAEQVEKTQIIQLAKAQKSTARSRRNSVLFGGADRPRHRRDRRDSSSACAAARAAPAAA